MTITIRRYVEADCAAVRNLFVRINEELTRADLREAFARYVEVSLANEIDRLADYYGEKGGAFYVAYDGSTLAGMFGIEGIGAASAELRRMYVDKLYRGSGLARAMLAEAERMSREAGTSTMMLSTSELQQAALAFYRKSGYRLVREETGAAQSNKTVGGAIRRYHFEKRLRTRA